MVLRRWKYEDILKITEIERECFGSEAWNYKMFVSSFESENFIGIVSSDGDEVIGYGGVTVAADCADLGTIAVTEPYRNSGVATAIMDELLSVAKQMGVKKIFLEVRVSNAAAMSLYLKHGFKGTYARPRYYPDGEDCLVMAKEL